MSSVMSLCMVIIAGHIDVSVGSLIGVLATISGTLAVRGYPIWVAWLASIVAGIAIQAVNGVLVAYARIPAIVVTLGMLSILKGGLISATSGAWITNLPPGFLLAQFRLFGILAPVWFAAVLTVLAALWMRYSALGRSIYAVGGNPDAARAAGIQTRPTVVFVFALHGFFAGIDIALGKRDYVFAVVRLAFPAGFDHGHPPLFLHMAQNQRAGREFSQHCS